MSRMDDRTHRPLPIARRWRSRRGHAPTLLPRRTPGATLGDVAIEPYVPMPDDDPDLAVLARVRAALLTL